MKATTKNLKPMKSKSIIKNTITVVLLLVLIVSCKEEKKNDNTKVENSQEEVTIKETLQEKQINGNAFETLKTSYYDDKGVFFREILMPTELLNSQRDPNYNLEIILRKDISSNGNYILFELYQHGNGSKIMKSNLVKQNTPKIKASHFSNFKPSDKKQVYVFSYHDEDFLTYSNEIKINIYTHIQEVVKTCVDSSADNCEPIVYERDIVKIINPKLIDKNKPNTIGGGVIPPK